MRERDYRSPYKTVSLKTTPAERERRMVDTLARSDQDIDGSIANLSKRRRVWLLTVASTDVLLVITSMVALNAALPDLAVATSATQTQLTWIVDGYTLVLACLLLPAGAIGDRYGRRGALLVGLAIFGLASIAPVILDSPLQIIIARAVAGAGAAFIMPATLSLLTAAFPKSERNKAVGIWAGMASSGAVFGFLGTGILMHFFSWQSIFYAFAAAAVGMFILTCTIGSSRDETATPIDWNRRGAHRRRRSRVRVRRYRGPRAWLDQPRGLGLHGRRRRTRGRVRDHRTAPRTSPARHPAVRQAGFRDRGASGSPSSSSPTSASSSSPCNTCS